MSSLWRTLPRKPLLKTRFSLTQVFAQCSTKTPVDVDYKTYRLDSLKGTELYPHKFSVTMKLGQFIGEYRHLEAGSVLADESVNLAGRIVSIRTGSKKLKFVDLTSDGQRLQLKLDASRFESFNEFSSKTDVLRRGDNIGIVRN